MNEINSVAVFLKKLVSMVEKVRGIRIIVIGIVLMGIVLIHGKEEVEACTIRTTAMPIQSTVKGTELGRGESPEPPAGNEEMLAPNLTLVDQYGKTHSMREYKGKTVFLNFWASWCPPCKEEIPCVEALYVEFGENKKDVIILGVTIPGLGEEKSKEGIISFLKEKGYTFPTLFDETGQIAYSYNISAFPTAYIINPKGEVEGYIQGTMTKEMMIKSINEARKKIK